MIIQKATHSDGLITYFLIPHRRSKPVLKLFKYFEGDKDWQLKRSAYDHEDLLPEGEVELYLRVHGFVRLERISPLSFLVLTGWDCKELERIGRNLMEYEGKSIRK